MTERLVRAAAADKSAGMTLGELSAFVIDAQHMGIPSDAKVSVRIGWKSNITLLWAEGEPEN